MDARHASLALTARAAIELVRSLARRADPIARDDIAEHALRLADDTDRAAWGRDLRAMPLGEAIERLTSHLAGVAP